MDVSQVAFDTAGWLSVQGPQSSSEMVHRMPLAPFPSTLTRQVLRALLLSGEEEVTSGFIMLENGFGVMQTKRPEVSWAYEEGEGRDRG